MRASQGKQPQEQQAQLARSSRARYGHRAAVARASGAVLLTVALTSLSGAALANVDPLATGNNVNQVAMIEPAHSNNARSAPTSAQDLSLFGVLALGIIGLLWVRRHTSEL